MSEYQYYEFLAVDRPLTPRQIAEVRRHSTRARITATRFVNEYHWGEFHGDEFELLEHHFDVMVYYANWGTRRLMFGLPADAIDDAALRPYCSPDGMQLTRRGNRLILDLDSDTEEPEDWNEHEEGSPMASLAPARAELLAGDLRPAYLAWLADLPCREARKGETEPPVPPGLGDLTAAQRALAEFVRVDADLLSVATDRSGHAHPSAEGVREWVAALPAKERDDLLAQLIGSDDPHAAAKLRRRVERERSPPPTPVARRRVDDLLEFGRARGDARRELEHRRFADETARAQRAARAARQKHLQTVIARRNAIWNQVEALAALKKGKAYDEAVELLRDLSDSSELDHTHGAFVNRLAQLRQAHATKRRLIAGIDDAGLE